MAVGASPGGAAAQLSVVGQPGVGGFDDPGRQAREPGARSVVATAIIATRCLWVPIIRSWALTRGFALHPGTRNRYEIRDTRTQHRPPSRHVNDRGRVPAATGLLPTVRHTRTKWLSTRKPQTLPVTVIAVGPGGTTTITGELAVAAKTYN